LALIELAQALVEAGDHDRAEQIARTITDSDQQVQALTRLARAVVKARDHDRARRLATDAAQITHTITNPHHQPQTLTELALKSLVLSRTSPDR
jgi:lipopolysaccharide biosynthesis regulator YciM